MRLEELKKGLWGYKKEGVFQYITELEETCSRKLQDREAQAERAEQQAGERIRALEQENGALKEELAVLRGRQDRISAAILDARASAEAMKAESRAQEEAARAETQAREAAARETIRRTLEAELAELDRYREKVAALRESVHRTLEELQRRTEALERQAEALDEASPAGNLTLFQ